MLKTFLVRLLGLGRNLIAFLLPILARHGSDLIESALPIARDIVASFEQSDADGEAKRALAVQRLREELLRAGHATTADLSTSLLNWIVETALQRVRAGS